MNTALEKTDLSLLKVARDQSDIACPPPVSFPVIAETDWVLVDGKQRCFLVPVVLSAFVLEPGHRPFIPPGNVWTAKQSFSSPL